MSYKQRLVRRYAKALDLYPASFRRSYKKPMLHTFEDQIEHDSPLYATVKLGLLYVELIPHVVRQRLISRGASLNRQSSRKFWRLSLYILMYVVIWALIAQLPEYLVSRGYESVIIHSSAFRWLLRAGYFVVPIVIVLIVGINIMSLVQYRNRLSTAGSSARLIIAKAFPALLIVALCAAALGSYSYNVLKNRESFALQSQQLEQQKQSAACRMFTVDMAEQYFGSSEYYVVANEPASDQSGTGNQKRATIDTVCLISGGNFSTYEYMLTMRRSSQSTPASDFERQFFANVQPGEQSIGVAGYDGFYRTEAGMVIVRVWAHDTWIEVQSGSLDDSVGIVQDIVVHYRR